MRSDPLPLLQVQDITRDHHPLNLAGALANRHQPRVAVDALYRELGRVAVATVNLDGVARYPLGHLSGEQLGLRRGYREGLTVLLEPGRAIHQQPRRLDLRRG